MKSNCLWYALDQWHTIGGRLGLVRSTHWCIPHVQHTTPKGLITQFVPPSDLRMPWHSVFGFEGIVEIEDRDQEKRGPMHPICTFMGTMLLAVQGAVWFFTRYVLRIAAPTYPSPLVVVRS